MKLDQDGWFVRVYLNRSATSWRRPLPNTVCELTWMFLGRTTLFSFVSFAITFVASMFFYGSYLLALLTFSNYKLPANGIEPMAITIAGFCWLILTLIGILLLHTYLNDTGAYHRAIRTVLPKSKKAEFAVNEPGIVSQWISGIYARVKDKTCVMISYK